MRDAHTREFLALYPGNAPAFDHVEQKEILHLCKQYTRHCDAVRGQKGPNENWVGNQADLPTLLFGRAR